METEKCQIEALTRNIEQSRAELKQQEDDFKYQLQEQEKELTRISTWLHEHQAEFKVCLSKKEQLERKYDADVKKLLEVTKKQDDIEAVTRLEDSKLIASMTGTEEKTKGELMKAKEQISSLIKDKKRLEKRIKESETGETGRMKEMEEEIQVLTAQVNAYSREVEKQKGLVTQSQEKHKTEVNELNERLANEIKSKQQLGGELTRMRQQLANVSANKEELLAAYDQERAIVTKLKNEVETFKQANTVLKDKLRQQLQTPSAAPHNVGGFQHVSHPLPAHISTRQNFESSAPVPSGPKQVVQSDGVLVLSKTEGVTPVLHVDTSVPGDAPQLSKEELARMFNRQGSNDWNQSPQQGEDLLVKEQKRKEIAMKADDAVLEVERLRESRQNVKKQSSISTKKPPPPSQQTSSKQKAKPKVKKDQAKQQVSDDSDSDIEENKLIDNIDEEIQQMAEDVRKGSRGPTTAKVLFDDGDKVLMEKLKAYKSRATPTTGNPWLSAYGGGARDEYIMNQEETHHHSSRLNSDDVANVRPQMTAEDMARLFKHQQQQPAPYPGAAYNTPPSLIQSEEDTDKLLKELDHSRKAYVPPPQPSPVRPQSESDSSQELSEDDKDDDDDDRPLDLNLICTKCGKQYREGQIQKLRRHMNAPCSDDDSDESNKLIDNIDEEIQQMAEDVRKGSRGPTTAEVLFDDGDSSLPYDPNLVCPKCGKQYRVGEIQKLRRHMNEFCTGIR